jgi:hypothetical protein
VGLDFGGENQMRIKELLILVIKKQPSGVSGFHERTGGLKKGGYLIPFQSFD